MSPRPWSQWTETERKEGDKERDGERQGNKDKQMGTKRKAETKMKWEKRGIRGNERRHLREYLIEFHHPCQTNGFVSTDLSSNLQNNDFRGEVAFFRKVPS